MKYEINQEKLESLSIADLTGLYSHYYKLKHLYAISHEIILEVISYEIDKRINDIIIF